MGCFHWRREAKFASFRRVGHQRGEECRPGKRKWGPGRAWRRAEMSGEGKGLPGQLPPSQPFTFQTVLSLVFLLGSLEKLFYAKVTLWIHTAIFVV